MVARAVWPLTAASAAPPPCQGGACEEGGDWTYENGFLLADARQRALVMGGELLIEASVNLPTGGRRRGLRRGDGGDAPLGGGEGSSGQGPQHLERPLDPDRHRVSPALLQRRSTCSSPFADRCRRRVLLRRAQGAMRRKGAGLAAASPHCCTPRSSTSSPPPLPAQGWWDGEGPFDWKRSVGEGRAGGARGSLSLSASPCLPLPLGAGGRAHAKLDVRGRERAGADHLAAAAGRVSDGSLAAGDVAGWLGWMAGVLRDEESGAARWGASGDGSSTHCPHHAPTPTPCQASASGLLTASCRRARRSRGARPGTGSGSQRAPPGGAAASCLACRLARGGGHTASHFFTAASDPLVACYKRWTFGDPAAAAAGDGGSLALWRRWRSIDLAGRSVPEAMRRALLEIEAEAVSAAERGGASEFSGSVARELELISSFAV